MVKSDNAVPYKYVSASPLAQNFVWKVIFFLLIRVSPLSIGPTFPKVWKILAHICQIKWNLISFDDENDKKTLNKRSYTEKNIWAFTRKQFMPRSSSVVVSRSSW